MSYLQGFALPVTNLAEEVRLMAAARMYQDQDEERKHYDRIRELVAMLQGEGMVTGDACQQVSDMAVSAAVLTVAETMGTEGIDEHRQCFADACEPCPEEVGEELWQHTRKLFLAAGYRTCAELTQNSAEAAQQERAFNHHSRAIMNHSRSVANTRDPGEFARDAQQVLPATVVMFSGCKDEQTSADVSNTASFQLPSNSGPGGAGGACTSSIIKALGEHDQYSWASLLLRMRDILEEKRYEQIPMLSSSREMNLNGPFSVRNARPSGRFRALLVGINYVGSSSELRGCHNDVEMMKRYLISQGFDEGDMRIFLDDGAHQQPTKANMVAGFHWLVQGAEAGDSLFFHYSGHGTSVADDNGDEADGKDEALVPCDYSSGGLIRDDEAFQHLVGPLKEGALLTCVLDCCHSGTILDLPYMFKADSQGAQAAAEGHAGMQPNPAFNIGKLIDVIKQHPGMAAGAGALTGLAFFLAGPERGALMGKAALDVLTADDKAAAMMNAAKNVFKGFFG